MNPRILHASKASRGVPATGPRGLTLVEMLIGMAITLLMMAAIVNLFANIGSGVRIRRASMEMGGQLRMVRATLFNDLSGATCRALPWQRPDEDPGYLEIVEGARSDKEPTTLVLDAAISQVPGSQATPAGQITDGMGLGDFDDILALTVRGEAGPFRGRYVDSAGQPDTIESNVAEVIWFAVENPGGGTIEEPGIRKVYRRVLLVAPWADLSGIAAPTGVSEAEYERFYLVCDVSVRIGVYRDRSTNNLVWQWVPNTLGDLSKRENRFGHHYGLDTTGPVATTTGFPHYFPHDLATTPSPINAGTGSSLLPLTGDREGEDLMLDNVLAFDLLVFDPGAPLFQYENVIIEPVSDNVFTTANAVDPGNLVGFGAFVDLGWDDNEDYNSAAPPYVAANAQLPSFQQERRVGWNPSIGITSTDTDSIRTPPVTYDTWSYHYEHDGLDQDDTSGNDNVSDGDTNTGLIDEGANGLDDDGANGVDDIGERETSPPYPVPLRGMQVKLRIYDPDTRQIREATVTRNFVPQ